MKGFINLILCRKKVIDLTIIFLALVFISIHPFTANAADSFYKSMSVSELPNYKNSKLKNYNFKVARHGESGYSMASAVRAILALEKSAKLRMKSQLTGACRAWVNEQAKDYECKVTGSVEATARSHRDASQVQDEGLVPGHRLALNGSVEGFMSVEAILIAEDPAIYENGQCKFHIDGEYCKNIAHCLSAYSVDPEKFSSHINFVESLIEKYKCDQ